MLSTDSVQEFKSYLSAALYNVVAQKQDISLTIPRDILPKRLVVGFSGGLDSTVLLYALKALDLPLVLSAIHIDHGLSPHAHHWGKHCQSVANDLDIPLLLKKYSVYDLGEGLESAARIARYCAYEESVDENTCLLTAHHRDDQVETLLFRLMRGAGVAGLAAIPSARKLSSGWILRPLLGVTRSQMDAYALANNLTWVDDESNLQLDYDRNFIRHKVVPVLTSRWPAIHKKVVQTASLMSDTHELLADYAQEDLDFCQRKTERIGQSMCIDKYMSLSVARRKHIIRHWVTSQKWQAPSQVHLAELESMLQAKPDAAPLLQLAQYQFRRYQNRLYLLPPLVDIDHSREYVWRGNEALSLGNGLTLSLSAACEVNSLPGVFQVRFRQGGERCQPHGRDCSQTLKKLFQEYHLEPWLRNLAPLIFLDDELIAVADLFVCQHNIESLAHGTFLWRCN